MLKRVVQNEIFFSRQIVSNIAEKDRFCSLSLKYFEIPAYRKNLHIGFVFRTSLFFWDTWSGHWVRIRHNIFYKK